jgi:hypothetical protein
VSRFLTENYLEIFSTSVRDEIAVMLKKWKDPNGAKDDGAGRSVNMVYDLSTLVIIQCVSSYPIIHVHVSL